MATIDLTTQEAPWAYPARPGGGPSYSIAKLVDFSEVNEKAGMGAADIIKLVKIPANTIVQAVAYRVFKASANLASLDIGDSAGPTQYATALDMTSIKDGSGAHRQVLHPSGFYPVAAKHRRDGADRRDRGRGAVLGRERL